VTMYDLRMQGKTLVAERKALRQARLSPLGGGMVRVKIGSFQVPVESPTVEDLERCFKQAQDQLGYRRVEGNLRGINRQLAAAHAAKAARDAERERRLMAQARPRTKQEKTWG